MLVLKLDYASVLLIHGSYKSLKLLMSNNYTTFRSDFSFSNPKVILKILKYLLYLLNYAKCKSTGQCISPFSSLSSFVTITDIITSVPLFSPSIKQMCKLTCVIILDSELIMDKSWINPKLRMDEQYIEGFLNFLDFVLVVHKMER